MGTMMRKPLSTAWAVPSNSDFFISTVLRPVKWTAAMLYSGRLPYRWTKVPRRGGGDVPHGASSWSEAGGVDLGHDRQRSALRILEEGHPLLRAVRVTMDQVWRVDE